MKRPSVALVALLWSYGSIFGQGPRLTVLKLEAAVYPAMAVAARVSGEVILNMTLSSDGSTESVTVESGPPMLRQAAIDSATRSHFQTNPSNQVGTYGVVYRYALDQTDKCDHDDSYPRVTHDANLVTITEQNVPICDPVAVVETIRFRSAKCLYLWRCGSKTP